MRIMDNNVSRLNEGRGRDLAQRRTLRDQVLNLVERHGEDYAVEGKRLLRRLVRTITVVGVLFGVLAGSLVVLVIRDVLR
jgi:hypothetical protein